jgi:hypothetical protein
MTNNPDMTVVVIRPVELPPAQLRPFEAMIERQGQSKHVLYILVTLTSDFEKRMVGIRDGQPTIQVKGG